MATTNTGYAELLAEEEEKQLLAGNQQTPLVVSGEETTAGATTSGYVSPYAQQIEEALGKVQNSAFQYNQQEDPNWQAMRKQYLLEAERSMKDTLGQASMATGGRASTAAVAAASQAADYYKSQLNAQQQVLFQNAYDRYSNEYAQELNKLAALQAQDATAYQRYLDDKNAEIAAEQEAYERDIYAQEQAQALKDTAYERLVTLIASTGYSPSEEELAAAGMSANEAKSWLNYYNTQMALTSSSGSSGGSSWSGSGGSGSSSSGSGSGGSGSGSSGSSSAIPVIASEQKVQELEEETALKAAAPTTGVYDSTLTKTSDFTKESSSLKGVDTSYLASQASKSTGSTSSSGNKTSTASSGSTGSSSSTKTSTTTSTLSNSRMKSIISAFNAQITQNYGRDISTAKRNAHLKNIITYSGYSSDQKTQLLKYAGLM